MENLPHRNAAPSCEGLDTKPAFQSKQNYKGKSRQARRSANNYAVAPSPAASLNTSNEQASTAVSVISALQEFVQDSKTYRMPMRHAILQWSFEEAFPNSLTVQFRATVAFVLEGVPHHASGGWQASKNLAKRDAAEGALGLFVGQWGCHLLQEEMNQPESTDNLMQSDQHDWSLHADQGSIDSLKNFCRHFPPCQQILPDFRTSWEGNSCTGLVDVTLFGVPHTFQGVACKDEHTAHSDAARRVLWYLQCPGFADAFDVDIEALVSRSEIAAPPSWTGEGAAGIV